MYTEAHCESFVGAIHSAWTIDGDAKLLLLPNSGAFSSFSSTGEFRFGLSAEDKEKHLSVGVGVKLGRGTLA